MTDEGEAPGRAGVALSAVIRLGLFPVVFLWPAGTWRWWEAWTLIGLYYAYAVVMTIWLRRNDPALLRERMNASPAQRDQKGWDKVLSVVMIVFGFGIFLVPGFDLMRFGWSESLPLWLKIAALALHPPCFLFIGWVMRENTYLSRVVKIDTARGHSVITTGPYAIVRHPMYSAVILMVMAMPVALGSRWALIPAAAMSVLLIVRTILEDRTLHAELDGYPEYAEVTRHRLIPGVW